MTDIKPGDLVSRLRAIDGAEAAPDMRTGLPPLDYRAPVSSFDSSVLPCPCSQYGCKEGQWRPYGPPRRPRDADAAQPVPDEASLTWLDAAVGEILDSTPLGEIARNETHDHIMAAFERAMGRLAAQPEPDDREARIARLVAALTICEKAINSGRSEPLFMAQNVIRNTLEDEARAAIASTEERGG